MVCYLDFEANGISQTQEIISIGAVTETGESFYSLVRPHARLDKKIKQLTNISQEEAEIAPSIEEVMSEFYHWLFKMKNGVGANVQYYVYGSEDTHFIDCSIALTDDEVTKARLMVIQDNIENVSKRVAKKFNRDSIGLRSAYLTMILSSDEPAFQRHNALEDAEMLKYVWEHLEDYEMPEGVIPIKVPHADLSYKNHKNSGKRASKKDPKYMVAIKAWRKTKKKGYQEWVFPNVAAASGMVTNTRRVDRRLRAMDKILEACETGEKIGDKYFAFVTNENSFEK